MDDINLKKLISSFLTLAIIASVLALILPPIYSGFTNLIAPTPQSLTFLNQSSSTTSSSPNAFLPKTETLADYYNSTVSEFNSNGSVNLTQLTAKEFAQALVSQNPSGPTKLDDNGNFTMNLPDVNQVINKVNNYVIANNSLAIPQPPYQYKIINNPTAAQNTDYFNSVIQIINNTLLNNSSQEIYSNISSPNDFSALSLIYDQAVQSLAAINVPKNLIDFHKSLMTYLYDKKYVYDEISQYTADPLKAAIIAQAGQNGLIDNLDQTNLQNFKNNLESLKFVSKISQKNIPDQIFSILYKLLAEKALATTDVNQGTGAEAGAAVGAAAAESTAAGLQTAAQTEATAKTITTIPIDISSVSSITLEKELAEMTGNLIQIQKNTAETAFVKTTSEPLWKKILTTIAQQVVHQLIAETVQWINNGYKGGGPYYITNWQDALNVAANNAAGLVISQIAPFLCSPFSAQLELQLYAPSPSQQIQCTLGDVENNLQNFADNFSNGGWLAYEATAEPQNTLMGAQIIAQEAVSNAANQAQQSASQQNIANAGFKANVVCDQPSQKAIDEGIGNYDVSNLDPDSPYCAHSVVVTPGVVAKEALASAIGSDYSQIFSAQDIDALVGALANSLITNIIKSVKGGLSGVNNNNYQYQGPSLASIIGQYIPQNQIATSTPDIATLDNDLNNINNWISAEGLLEGIAGTIPSLVNQFNQSLNNILIPMTKNTNDVTPTDCVNYVTSTILGPFLNGLQNQATQNTKIALSANDQKTILQDLKYNLEALKDSVGNITPTDPEVQVLTLIASSTLNKISEAQNQIANSEALISSSTDPIELNNNLSYIIKYLQNTFLPSPGSININLKNYDYITPIIQNYVSSTIPALQTISNNQLSQPASQLKSVSSSLNNLSNDNQILNNIIINNINEQNIFNIIASTTAAEYQIAKDLYNASSVLPNEANTESANFDQFLNNIEIDINSFSTSTGESLPTINYFTALDFPSYATDTLIFNNYLNQIITGFSNGSYYFTDTSTVLSSLNSAIATEISNDTNIITTDINTLNNTIQSSNALIATPIMNSLQALNQLSQNLNFNNIVSNIYNQASQYSNVISQLQQSAALQCGIKKELNKKNGTFLQQLSDAANPPSGIFGDISGQLWSYIPLICKPIDSISSICQRNGDYTLNCTIINTDTQKMPLTYILDKKSNGDIVYATSTSGGQFSMAFNVDGNFISRITQPISFAEFINNYPDAHFPANFQRSISELIGSIVSALPSTGNSGGIPDISCSQ